MYLYEKSCQRYFENLRLAELLDSNKSMLENPSSITESDCSLSNLSISEHMHCSYCDVDFIDRSSQVDHYKSDWHRYNLKQKMQGKLCINENNFEDIMCNDLSSISGSDSETEEEEEVSSFSQDNTNEVVTSSNSYIAEYRYPKVFFHNNQEELLSIYRCVLYGKRNIPETVEEITSLASHVLDHMKWGIFMAAGNHFAGAIFEGEDLKLHKTFHRYIVRAKRGSAQSSHDKMGSAAKSAGANLRRYNEAALAQEVKDLLLLWSTDIALCHRIFVRAPSFNKALLFGGKSPVLKKDDIRIRQIPFPTRRPTIKELKRVHQTLATIECYGKGSTISDVIQLEEKTVVSKFVLHKDEDSQPVKEIKTQSKSHKNKESPEIVDCDLIAEDIVVDFNDLRSHESSPRNLKHKKKRTKSPTPEDITEPMKLIQDQLDETDYRIRNELYTACKIGDTDMLNKLLENLNDLCTKKYENEDTNSADVKSNDSDLSENRLNYMNCILSKPFGDNHRNLLHVVALEGHSDLVQILLDSGCDPSLKDKLGKTAYILTSKRDVRNEFRRFMGRYPEKYDYKRAEIPGPLDEEKEAQKKALDVEKKKAAKKASKERLKVKKQEETAQQKEEHEKRRFMNLSEREKRAIMAERRFTEQNESDGKLQPVLSRCFQCGIDITGKVPFEYYDYKFCSSPCLKKYRTASKS